MGVLGVTLGSAKKGLSLAAAKVGRAVDRNLLDHTSEAERFAAKELAVATEREIKKKTLRYEATKKTDLRFVNERNAAAVERQKSQFELVLRSESRVGKEKVFRRRDGRFVFIAGEDDGLNNAWNVSSSNGKNPNRWAPIYDARGVLLKPPKRGPKFDPPSGTRPVTIDILAGRDLPINIGQFIPNTSAYVTVDLSGERVGTSNGARMKKSQTDEKIKYDHYWDTSVTFLAAKNLSDEEHVLCVVRQGTPGKKDGPVIGAVVIPVDAIEEMNSMSLEMKAIQSSTTGNRKENNSNSTSNVKAFWTKLQDIPPPPAENLGALHVSLFADADAPGRVRVHVIESKGKESLLEIDEKNKKRSALSSMSVGLQNAMTVKSYAYVRVSLLRVGVNSVPKKDDVRRTDTSYSGKRQKGTFNFDEKFVYENCDVDGDSSILFELFSENVIGEDDPVAQLAVSVKNLPKARNGDSSSKPREKKWKVHTRSKKFLKKTFMGSVCVSAYFLDDEKTRLKVRVLEARDIKAGDVSGTSDPYVCATLQGNTYMGTERNRMGNYPEPQVFRTTVIYGTTAPVWRHDFFFRVENSSEETIREDQFSRRHNGKAKTKVKQVSSASSCVSCQASDEAAGASSGQTGSTKNKKTVNDVRGQAITLDLFDHDFGDFDADDFLGRVVVPLDRIGTITDGADKRSEWFPWCDLRNANPLVGEVLVRCYFGDGNGISEGTPDSQTKSTTALHRRLQLKDKAVSTFKQNRLEREKLNLRRELEAQLRVALEAHDWPSDIAQRYSKAYAKHAHESHRVPPPPGNLVVPASFTHVFECAERAERGLEKVRDSNDQQVALSPTLKSPIAVSPTPVSPPRRERHAEDEHEPSSFASPTRPGVESNTTEGHPTPPWSLQRKSSVSKYFQSEEETTTKQESPEPKKQPSPLLEKLPRDSPWARLHADREKKLSVLTRFSKLDVRDPRNR